MGGLTPRAVLLDALGTLLRLEPPVPPLRAELAARFGLDLDEKAVRDALEREIAYYRAHNLEGADRDSLAALRLRCAEVLREGLGEPARGMPAPDLLEALLASLRFVAYDDVLPALRRIRAAGRRLVVVSNWDVSLHDRLAETGIAEQVDGAVASAEVGAAKPDRAIFTRALELAGVAASEALHAGDSPAEDVQGARAAGVEAVLVVRESEPDGPVGGRRARALEVRRVRSLAGVADLVA